MQYQGVAEFLAWLKDNGPLDVSATVKELNAATKNGSIARVNDIYDAKAENNLWDEYRNRSKRDPDTDGPPFCFREQVIQTTQILRADPACRAVVDFGAMYAAPTNALAGGRLFQNVRFYAVDRSANVKALNEAEFPQKNLHFIADDIFNFIGTTALNGAALVHNRTCMFLYPAAVEKLYRACAVAGIRHIIAIEWTGYSHELGRYYEFGEKLRESAVLRGDFFVHDYPNLMRAAGYRISSCVIKKLPMRKPFQQDAHIIVACGQKDHPYAQD